MQVHYQQQLEQCEQRLNAQQQTHKEMEKKLQQQQQQIVSQLEELRRMEQQQQQHQSQQPKPFENYIQQPPPHIERTALQYQLPPTYSFSNGKQNGFTPSYEPAHQNYSIPPQLGYSIPSASQRSGEHLLVDPESNNYNGIGCSSGAINDQFHQSLDVMKRRCDSLQRQLNKVPPSLSVAMVFATHLSR